VSDRARPESALRELELLVRSLGEELAGFRRRALEAERRLREQAAPPVVATPTASADGAPSAAGASSVRVAELERENEELRQRLGEASARTRQMVERVRFLRQQQERDGDR
jgi:hypothetical protein